MRQKFLSTFMQNALFLIFPVTKNFQRVNKHVLIGLYVCELHHRKEERSNYKTDYFLRKSASKLKMGFQNNEQN